MTVSVVIPHFYAAREPNLQVIVDAFMGGTVRPCEILIWANEPIRSKLSGASVITSHRNIGAQARFLAGLAAIGDAVLFLDNDVVPQLETVENLIANSRTARVATLEGRKYDGGQYRATPKIRGRDVTVPVRVDLSLGRCEMVLRGDLPRMLWRFPWGCEMDDMEFSAMARWACAEIDVVPCVDGRSFISNLPERDVGMSKGPMFYAARDSVMRRIMSEPCYGAR